MDKLKTIFKDNFIMVNKYMIKIFGLDAAVLLGELYSEYNYWKRKNKIDSSGYFYSTIENVEANTSLSKGKQAKAIQILEDFGIIKKHTYGMPAKRYFRFVEEGIEDLEYFINKEKSAEKDVNNVTEVSTAVKTSGYISENW